MRLPSLRMFESKVSRDYASVSPTQAHLFAGLIAVQLRLGHLLRDPTEM